jgi:hypothetical protein
MNNSPMSKMTACTNNLITQVASGQVCKVCYIPPHYSTHERLLEQMYNNLLIHDL